MSIDHKMYSLKLYSRFIFIFFIVKIKYNLNYFQNSQFVNLIFRKLFVVIFIYSEIKLFYKCRVYTYIL